MLTASFPASVFGTNCYVIAPGQGEDCVVVDPGIGVVDTLRDALEELKLRPAAVLLTHGHVDHVYSVTPVCGGTVGAYIHSDDRYRLVDPVSSLGPQLIGMFEQQFGKAPTWTEPSDVVEIRDHQTLQLAGMTFEVRHTPGHTEGSVLFGVEDIPDGLPPEAAVTSTVLSGDTLFAGSIGRTDLAGGDGEAMTRSLRDVILPLPDASLVLPGHGPGTTMARERATNPYLQNLQTA
ncbi:hydrolase [Flexivirga endophytica]|uniref:Hydrolase n=1 Tax=Flexivirga endophytica TaxID=1849103 RepID=A0A916T9S2_9MICO|nr:MBL fold metallo-hydrolase [Flexivirga endophytica]GGB36905.1 hydrolase [Flexivirga endophytica]GHB44453.1 hydrolase [Flexivirga endophytica]